MRVLRRFIKSNNIIMKAISLILAISMLGSSLMYLSNEKMGSVSAADPVIDKTYMKYIVQRLIDGLQDEFTVLEIVPYKGQGEFRYYASDKEVKEGLENNQSFLDSDASNILGDFLYTKEKDASGYYRVTAPNIFTEKVVTNYKTLISEVINVNTVEANDLKAEHINNADLIIINTGTNNANTIAMYRAFSGDDSEAVFTKEGNIVKDNGDVYDKSGNKINTPSVSINYNTFEEVSAEDILPELDDPTITTGRIYFKNENNWSSVYAFYSSSTSEEKAELPGVPMTLDKDNVYYIELNSNIDHIGFTNGTSNKVINPVLIEGFNKIYSGGSWHDYTDNLPKYTVTLPTDTNIVSSGATEIVDRQAYTVQLSPADGYVVLDTINIQIGGNEYTDFSYNSETGEIVIPGKDVIGNIVINATAVKLEEINKYTVTLPADTNIVSSGAKEAIEGKIYTVQLSPADGYELLDIINVKIGDCEYTDFIYDSGTGKIIIPPEDVTGNIVVNATAVAMADLQKYAVTLPVDTNIVNDGDIEVVSGKIYSATMSAKTGYKLPNTIEITIGGNKCENYYYDSETGEIVIPASMITGNVVIKATAEKAYAYKTRDMSWDMCEKLLDCMIKGRSLEMPDGTTETVKTPVIINNDGIAGLNKDTNMYKLMYIYRMCGTERWAALKDYLITSSDGVRCRNKDGIVTPAIKKEGTGLATDIIEWKVGADNPIAKLFVNLAANGTTFAETYYEENPFTKNYLSNDYWVYGENNWIIPKYAENSIGVSDAAFKNRVEDSATTGKESVTAINVLKYLLGVKSNQIYSFTNKLRVLEIQPSNSFDYDDIESIKSLGSALLRKDAGSWANINASKTYLSIDYVTPNELNGIKDDIASHYDVVIIGDNTDIMTKRAIEDSNGNITGYETIYNDRNLNGYIYLAFGDLYKMSTNMLGGLPDEFIEVPSDYSSIKDSNNKSIIPISEKNAGGTSLWSPLLQSRLSAINENGYFIVHDLYKYYVTNVGDRYIGSGENKDYLANASGVIDNEEFYLDYYLGNSRFPDNDITDITKEKLRDFVKTGNPIIVSDSIYNADRTKLYPTSDMYNFAKTILRDENDKHLKNVVRKDAIGRSVAFLGAKAPEIEFKKGTVEYYTKTNNTTKITINNEEKEYYVYSKNTGNDMPIKPVDPVYTENTNVDEKYKDGVVNRFNSKKLHYNFYITGEVNATYKVKLLIDKNNDGVYKDNADDPKDNELYYAENVTLKNTRKIEHTIETQLSNDFRGMLSWKLVVVKLDENRNETVYKVEEKGYSAIFRGDETKTPYVITDNDLKKIDVLQLYPGYTNLDLASDTFKNLFNQVRESVGYNITVTKKSVADFNNLYNGNAYEKGSADKGFGSTRDQLKEYEMIVFGFADSFNFNDVSNTNGALDNILDFIDDDRAVLLTHDTLSWRSAPNYVSGYIKETTDDAGNVSKVLTYSGASAMPSTTESGGSHDNTGDFKDTSPTLTFMLRNRAGMDKYGVTLLPISEDSNGKYDPGDENIYRYGKEVPMYEAIDSNDTDYRPSYMSTNEVREIQGFNTWMIWRHPFVYRHLNYYPETKGKNYYMLRGYSDGDYIGYNKDENATLGFTNNWESGSAVCLNEGPVTKYPFEVGNKITVNSTHAQYFELDMEDEEVVVWYSLAGGGVNTYYGISDMDAANNYYIYSKGNITYSGAGHGSMSDVSTEYKLFVNTIVKAIAGCSGNSTINVTNGSAVGGNNYVVYVDSTYSASQYMIGFNATDPDLISLETTNNNYDLVGSFEKAEIYWWNPTSAAEDKWELIKNSDYQSKNDAGAAITTEKLKNGVQQNLTLANTGLSTDKLNQIEQLVEDGEKVGAKFRIIVEDSVGDIASVEITLRVRDLFNLN